MTPILRNNLCETCVWMREIRSGKGSRFLMCQRGVDDPAYRKYPALPVTRCAGHEVRGMEQISTVNSPEPSSR